MPSTHCLQIADAGAGPALSAQQKRFNNRIRQIEQARRKLLDWETHARDYRQAHGELLRPLQQSFLAGRHRWAFALDAALDRRDWGKADRKTLTGLLLEAAGELLDGGSQDQALRMLFDKHSDIDFEAARRENLLAMKSVAEAVTGLDLGDDDGLDTDEALFERLEQGMRTQAEAHEDAARARKPATRRKTAAQQRREDEERQPTRWALGMHRLHQPSDN